MGRSASRRSSRMRRSVSCRRLHHRPGTRHILLAASLSCSRRRPALACCSASSCPSPLALHVDSNLTRTSRSSPRGSSLYGNKDLCCMDRFDAPTHFHATCFCTQVETFRGDASSDLDAIQKLAAKPTVAETKQTHGQVDGTIVVRGDASSGLDAIREQPSKLTVVETKQSSGQVDDTVVVCQHTS